LEELVALTHSIQMSGALDSVELLKDLLVTSDEELEDFNSLIDVRALFSSLHPELVQHWLGQLLI